MESVTLLVIADIPEVSWITSIAGVCNPGGEPDKAFIISISGSSVLREYNVSGSHIRFIETRDYVCSSSIGITCVAYNENTIAVIARVCDYVIFISVDDGTVKQCGSLGPPLAGLLPVIDIWTGAYLQVLYISDSTELQWKVISYDVAGKQVKVPYE